MDIVEIYHLKKYFWEGVRQIKALDGIDLAIEKGRLTAITGASGSGKTTLLNTIGGLYRPTQGEVWVDGINLGELSEEQLTVFRRRKVGFVFQDYNLIPELTVRENILFPLALDGLRTDEVFFREIVGLLGLEPRLGAYSYELSGGERQRIAIARAMLKDAPIVILDEATAYIDPENEAVIQKAIAKLVRGKTVIVIAHRLSTIKDADKIVVVKDGRIEAAGKHEELRKTCPLYESMWQAHIGAKDGDVA